MPDPGMDYHPRALQPVASTPLAQHFADLTGQASRWIFGLGLTYDGLTAHVSTGRHFMASTGRVAKVTAALVDEVLDPSTTNYIYIVEDGTITHNATGVAPAGSALIWEADTDGSTVIAIRDRRSPSVILGVLLKALGLDALGQKVVNVADPTAATDGVNYQTLLAIASAAGVVKMARAATTAALPANTYLNGVITASANGALANQDGVALVVGNRLLVKNEAAALKNGIYTVTQVGTGGTPFILTRATDYDSAAEILAGSLVSVSEGTTQADSLWALTTDGTVVVGTTALAFSRKDVDGHAAVTAVGVHGSTNAPTPSTLMHRDADGRSQVEAGAAAKDIVNKAQMDAAVAAEAAARAADVDAEEAARIADVDAAEAAAKAYSVQRANHTGTQAPNTIAPQGAGSGLNADAVDGYEPDSDPTGNTLGLRMPDGRMKGADGTEVDDFATIGQLGPISVADDFPANYSPILRTDVGQPGSAVGRASICALTASVYVIAYIKVVASATYEVYVIRTADGGETWSAPVLVSTSNTTLKTHVCIVRASDTVAYLAYCESTATPRVRFHASTDAGQTWDAGTNIRSAATAKARLKLSVSPTDPADVWAVYQEGANVRAAVSTNSGAAWTDNLVSAVTPSALDIAAASDTTAIVAYTTGSGGSTSVLRTTLSGTAWVTVATLTPAGTNSNPDAVGPFRFSDNRFGVFASAMPSGTGNVVGLFAVTADGATWTQLDVDLGFLSWGPGIDGDRRYAVGGTVAYTLAHRQNGNESYGLGTAVMRSKGGIGLAAPGVFSGAMRASGGFGATADPEGRILTASIFQAQGGANYHLIFQVASTHRGGA